MKLPLQNHLSCRTLTARLLACALATSMVGVGGVHAQGHKSNTSTGLKAGDKVTTGKNNTADGFSALQKNKTGSFNTAVGSKALKKSTGSSNVAMGFQALFKNKGGQFNVAIGDGAMKFNVKGNNNVSLGMDAGANTTGNDNILIDHVGVAGESGKIRIGMPGTHSDTYLSGVVHGNGSALTGVTATSVSGSVSGSQIAAGSITGAKLAPNLSLTGNVGIGTSNPSSKLEVRGDIELGSFGQYQATASTEKLRIVRGLVNFLGNIVSGSGFTVSKNGTGTFEITYSSAFAETPAFVATAEDAAAPQIVTYAGTSSSSVIVKIWNTADVLVDSNFSFTAIGAR